METPDKLTLRDLVKSGGLYVLERRTAVQLREGDRVLYVPEGTSLDVDLDQVRNAVQVVTLEPSSMDGSLSVAVPGTNNTVTIPLLPGLYGVGQLPMGTNGREIHFYYMPPEGPIPEWRMREPSTVTAATRVNSYVSSSSTTRSETPERDALFDSMNVLPSDVARLIYTWFQRTELAIVKQGNLVRISAYDDLSEDFFDLLATQLNAHGLSVDRRQEEQVLGPHQVLTDIYRIYSFIRKGCGLPYTNPSEGARFKGSLIKNRPNRATNFELWPE